ncbi:zeta toxin family protein [Fulvivirgaceae bacterium PWU4]|uniref:Zeta toxin family protein n=1 Tax=Chryseosolibacter histidini TaxID=2782349 RepID=A0AAP2GMK1_9BACT|nr:zeta toxin family protein [Chryseosolibacter histidini]MBT1701364.1 zeta toxin family protein [Chryseosolibacter histidini]
MPFLYIIAGCNGAGKTTASYTVLPEMLECKEFVNADEIAKGLSPFQPETVAFEAGRIMLNRIRELLKANLSFALETTLSTKSYRSLIKEAKQGGYTVVLIFFWLESITLAKERVRLRVKKGGHNIPDDIIERRYHRGLVNFFKIYSVLSDFWIFYDNSRDIPSVVANNNFGLSVENNDIWTNLLKHYE